MRYVICALVAVLCALLGAPSPARAGLTEDCKQYFKRDLVIRACSDIIRRNPKTAWAYSERGQAYRDKGDLDRAIYDYTEAIRLNPKDADTYSRRGGAYHDKGDYDLAIADYTEAIRLNPGILLIHTFRATAYRDKGDYDRAIADMNTSIRLNPSAVNYSTRGSVYHAKGDYDRAIADFSERIRISPSDFVADGYAERGNAYLAKGDYGRAISDLDTAIRLDSKHASAYAYRGKVYAAKGAYSRAIADHNEAVGLAPDKLYPYFYRGHTYEAKGDRDKAIADYRKTLTFVVTNKEDRDDQAEAAERLAALERPVFTPPPVATPVAPVAPVAPPAASGPPGRRVALVIGNSAYGAIERLGNPGNDARAVAASLRRVGFAEVVERHDLGLAAMVEALKAFGDKTSDTDWAVVYYAGHGIEKGGTTYLIPTDAKLLRDAHVLDEALPLDRVLAKVETARKLRLVIIDACRNNPFLARMQRAGGGGRSIGRGLSRLEPEGGVIVAYAAKHGTIAQDGTSAHSPFTEALLAHLEEPGLEINFLFRKVRDRVLDRTGRDQEPFVYGSFGSELLYFKVAGAK